MKAVYIHPSFSKNYLKELNEDLNGSDRILKTITLNEGGVILIVNNSRQDKLNHLNDILDNEQ